MTKEERTKKEGLLKKKSVATKKLKIWDLWAFKIFLNLKIELFLSHVVMNLLCHWVFVCNTKITGKVFKYWKFISMLSV